jgi:hypothetical protein
MNILLITFILLMILTALELYSGQIFIHKSLPFPNRDQKPTKFWSHLSIHVIFTIITAFMFFNDI